MPLRRRAALSMIAGIDHGVGRILAAWTDQLQPAGLPSDKHNREERVWYREYFPPAVTPPTP
jgi:hypothetical protein